MDKELSDSNSVFLIDPRVISMHPRYKETFLGRLVHPNVVHVFLENDYEEERYDKPWRLHRRHLSMEIDSLVNVWRGKTRLEKLPDHFTAMLQLAKGLEYIHSQKWIHGDIKPENVLIFENRTGKAITLKWAYFGSFLPLSEVQKKFDIQGETNPKDGTKSITKFQEKQESKTNILKETGNTGELSIKQDGKLSSATVSVKQERKPKNQTINRILSIIEKRKIDGKFYEDKESRTYWLAPELQGVPNPLSLVTFHSDVFALGLVFGSLLLDGAHPFGDQDKEITSNMIKNKPVNFERITSKRALTLITEMLTQKAEERITSSQVVNQIQLIQNEMLEIPLLIEELGKNDVLSWYCRYFYQKENFFEAFKHLINSGINIQSVDKEGNNVLLYLCKKYKNHNLIDIIRLLIENGIDVNCKDKYGYNALHLLWHNYKKDNLIDLIRLLIEKGIDVNSKNSRSENVLDSVFENCKTDNFLNDAIVKLLIRHGIQLSNKNYEKIQKSGIEDRNGGLEILKYVAKEDLTLGWHKNCNSCENILSIEKSARRQVQHHQMFGNTYVAFHMILKDLQAWDKSAETDQDDPNATKILLAKAQNHFTNPEDKKSFKTMIEISEQIMKGGDSSLFQCNLYEHYMRSLHRVAGVIGAKKSQQKIEFFYLLPFDNPLSYPIDKMNDTEFKIALGEWDKTLFSWMHKPGDEYFGKTLKKDSKKGLFSQVNCSLNCHGKETEKM